MGLRKNGPRSLASSHAWRTLPGVKASPSGPPLRPLSHSSSVCQASRPPHKALWGTGGNYSNYNAKEDRPSSQGLSGTHVWNRTFGNNNKSPNSSSITSEGGSSISSDSTSSGSNRYGNIGSNKKAAARASNPLRYKTELCRSYEECGDCRFGTACTFAHGLRELRAVLRHPRYKTDMCRTYHGAGYCQYGARCHFVHGPEEAFGIAGLRGYRLRQQPDHGNRTMSAMLENLDIAPPLNANAMFLSNLQCLHEYKAVEEKFRFANSSWHVNDQLNSTEKLSPELSSSNWLTISRNGLLDLTPGSQPQGSIFGTVKDNSESIPFNFMSVKAPGSASSKVGRSAASHHGEWWFTEPKLTTGYSLPHVDAVHSSRADTWSGGEAFTQTKAVIENPMEVSRNLLLPSITDLAHMH